MELLINFIIFVINSANEVIMKKILLSVILIGSAVMSSIAQDGIEIKQTGQSTDVSGQTINVVAPDYQAFDVSLDIINNTGTTHQWRVTRLRISVPTGWQDGLCWGHGTDPFGGTCYSSGQMPGDSWTTPGSQSVLFNVADGEYAKLKATIDPDDFVSGTAHYRYYITDDGVTNTDSVDVVVNFTANIKEVKEVVSVSLLPNPATDYLTINLNGIENASYKIVDALGNVIVRETSINNNKKLDVSEFKNGVYFILIEGSGIKPINRKIVIRH